MTSGGPGQGWPGGYDPQSPSGQPWQQPPGQPYPQGPGQPYPYQQGPGQPYPPQGQPNPYQQAPGQPYQQAPGQPYAPQGQPYPPQGQPYPYQQGPGQPYQPAPGPAGGKPARKRSKLPMLITIVTVVIALAAAGVVYFVARKGSNAAAGGQSTPKEAVVQLLNSVQKSDPIGIASQLDPTEAHLFADITGGVLDQLKRLGVINSDVAADKLTDLSITTKDLTYADSPIVMNDHLQIVELTGGTITIQSAGGISPYSKKMLDVLPPLAQIAQPQTTTVDIAKEVTELGHPIRLATVKRDGKWYPSLFYTIADNWAYEEKGGSYSLDPIGNNGGSTPEDAMDKFVDALSSGDPRAVISVLSPDEMGVLHDYGNLMIGADGGLKNTGLGDAQVSNLSWSVTDVTGGKKVSVKTITVKTSDGDYSVERDPAAGSLKISMPGQGTINVNSDNIDTWLNKVVGEGQDLPQQVRDIIKREFSKVIGLGVVMVQGGDGKWYVSPLRSFSDVLVSLLSGLEPGDIDYFLSLAKK